MIALGVLGAEVRPKIAGTAVLLAGEWVRSQPVCFADHVRRYSSHDPVAHDVLWHG